MGHKAWYIAIQPNHWGRGENEKQAKANMRRAGGKGKSTVYMVKQDDSMGPPYVDMMGSLCHCGKGLVLVSGKDVLGLDTGPLLNRPQTGARSDVPPMPANPNTRCQNCGMGWVEHNGYYCADGGEDGDQWDPYVPSVYTFDYSDSEDSDEDEDNPF